MRLLSPPTEGGISDDPVFRFGLNAHGGRHSPKTPFPLVLSSHQKDRILFWGDLGCLTLTKCDLLGCVLVDVDSSARSMTRSTNRSGIRCGPARPASEDADGGVGFASELLAFGGFGEGGVAKSMTETVQF